MYLLFYIPVAVILLLLGLYSNYEHDNMELFFIENAHLDWSIIPAMLRAFHGTLWFLALMIALPNRNQRVALKAATTLLTFLTLYFGYHLFRYGNQAGCNCYSIYFPISLTWLVITLFALSAFCWAIAFTIKKISFSDIIPVRIQYLLLGLGFVTIFALAFLLNPLSYDEYNETANKPMQLDMLYDKSNIPSTDIRKGKYIVSVMSFSCPYCKIAARKMRVLKMLDNSLPLYMVLAGKKANETKFFAQTGVANVPHFKYTDKKTFWSLAENSIPAIYFINDGVIEYKIHYKSLNKDIVDEWLKK